jgi:hypothetical protein
MFDKRDVTILSNGIGVKLPGGVKKILPDGIFLA